VERDRLWQIRDRFDHMGADVQYVVVVAAVINPLQPHWVGGDREDAEQDDEQIGREEHNTHARPARRRSPGITTERIENLSERYSDLLAGL